ncbi:O-antigen ligase [Nitrosospira sp. Nsp5]|uniref:O-antigen ligase n=1 Tax=Nitrosospira multiformis TaxID=1231 RepID=A0ABY0TF52_9PROT|nr:MULTISPECIES: O-antigen ligase family protein [Nitrosospira]PTR10849.1 O-antigen ligase [Nitrosospira sp. Nsp5]SDQ73551.1 O-antigen ligase [Nitrosospira multiformis]
MSSESETRSPEDWIRQNPVASPRQTPSTFDWRDVLAISALFFFGIALWSRGLSLYAYYLLVLAWLLDGGLGRIRETIKEPLVLAMLTLCMVLALGILWSEYPKLGLKVWNRYFAYLIFIPYLSLLSKTRVSWAISGALIGYFGVLLIGIYQWIVIGAQGIPPLGITYLDFSTMLGIGVILTLYLAGSSNGKKARTWLWLLAVFLLFMQFNQNGRALLIATLVSSVFLLFLLHRKEIKKLLVATAALLVAMVFFAYGSDSFQQRLVQARSDIELSKQGKYDSSLGYRFAIWDVGLYGIGERPVLGHGTGMAAPYFDKTVETYKGGLYKDLPNFLKTYHYHNDWIEIGMQMGALGMLTYAFFLWSWLRTLKAYQLGIPGAAFTCFIILFGLTDVLVIFRQNLYLLLVITAIGVAWQKAYATRFLSE